MIDSPGKVCLSPVRSTPENSSESGKEERGDLIKFYNAVYVGRVKSFALKYDVTNQDHVVSNIILILDMSNSVHGCLVVVFLVVVL